MEITCPRTSSGAGSASIKASKLAMTVISSRSRTAWMTDIRSRISSRLLRSAW